MKRIFHTVRHGGPAVDVCLVLFNIGLLVAIVIPAVRS